MTLQQLKYFIAVNKYESFSKAAEALFVTQPMLSLSIKKLEKELDINLFERMNHGVKITNDGMKVLKHAKNIMLETASIKKVKENKKANRFIIDSISFYRASNSYAKLAKIFIDDDCEFIMRSKSFANVLKGVQAFEANLGVIAVLDKTEDEIRASLDELHLNFEILASPEPKLYLHKNHPILREGEFSFNKLFDYPIAQNIDLIEDFGYLEAIPFVDTKKIIKAHEWVSIANIIASTDAYCFAFKEDQEFLDRYNLVQITVPNVKPMVLAVYNKLTELSTYHKTFINILKSQINNDNQ